MCVRYREEPHDKHTYRVSLLTSLVQLFSHAVVAGLRDSSFRSVGTMKNKFDWICIYWSSIDGDSGSSDDNYQPVSRESRDGSSNTVALLNSLHKERIRVVQFRIDLFLQDDTSWLQVRILFTKYFLLLICLRSTANQIMWSNVIGFTWKIWHEGKAVEITFGKIVNADYNIHLVFWNTQSTRQSGSWFLKHLSY